jgi:hypothetical protein
MLKRFRNAAIVAVFSAGVSGPCLADGVNVDQIPGDTLVLQQSGSANSATIEQQAILGATYSNAISIQQSGANSSVNMVQQGQQNGAAIVQSGNSDQINAWQNGTDLGLQISQYGNNSSIGVKQFGTGGGVTVSVKQF